MTRRRDEVVRAALDLLEAEGPDALTMRRLASRLGIKAPSLYEHVAGRPDLLAGLQHLALVQQAEALTAAGPDLASVAAAYRGWALAHPHLYRLATRTPLDRARIPSEVEAAAAAPLLALVGGDGHLARGLWALAHGLIDLELAGRFPPGADVDETWRTSVRVFAAAVPG